MNFLVYFLVPRDMHRLILYCYDVLDLSLLQFQHFYGYLKLEKYRILECGAL
jgi:hypothetical protein